MGARGGLITVTTGCGGLNRKWTWHQYHGIIPNFEYVMVEQLTSLYLKHIY